MKANQVSELLLYIRGYNNNHAKGIFAQQNRSTRINVYVQDITPQKVHHQFVPKKVKTPQDMLALDVFQQVSKK